MSNLLARSKRARAIFFVALLATPIAEPAVAAIPPAFVTLVDSGGQNDGTSAEDLTQLGYDTSDPGVFKFFWSWDATDDWSEIGQTGDACALFDTDENGNVDLAFCAVVLNDGASVVQSGSTFVFTCGDAKNDRCSSPVVLSPPPGAVESGVLTAGSPGASPPGDLVSDTDPFANFNPDQNWPSDSTVEIAVLTSFLPPGAELLNVCTIPNAATGGNNNPFDCILVPVSVPAATIDVSSTTTLVTAAGEIVPYSYLVTNTGSLTLTGTAVTDNQVDPVSCPATTLVPAESMTCTGTHTMTAMEIEAGGMFVNIATLDSDQTAPVTDTFSICAGACPPNKCDAAKMKCVAKRQSCVLGVHAVATGKGVPIDGAKLQKCFDTFDACIAKLEAKQIVEKPETLCTVTGDVETLEQMIDAFTLDAIGQIRATP